MLEQLSTQKAALQEHILNWARLDAQRYRPQILEAAARCEFIDDQMRRVVEDWREDLHPRDRGRFARKAGVNMGEKTSDKKPAGGGRQYATIRGVKHEVQQDPKTGDWQFRKPGKTFWIQSSQETGAEIGKQLGTAKPLKSNEKEQDHDRDENREQLGEVGDRGPEERLPAGERLGGDPESLPGGEQPGAGEGIGSGRGAGRLPGDPDLRRDDAGGTAGERGDAAGGGTGDRPEAAVSGAGVEQPQTERVREVLSAPPTPETPTDLSAGNWRYQTRDFYKGGLKAKFKANIEALQTLRTMQVEGRDRATPEEQEKMSKFVGWGQFPALFNDYSNMDYKERSARERAQGEFEGKQYNYKNWEKEQQQLHEVLTPEEWDAARHSTTNGHFTSPEVVDANWKMAEKLGYRGGRFLETSAGIGYYLGMMPPELAAKTRSAAVELDSGTGTMLQAMYPSTHVEVTGFEKYRAPDNYYDLVASNVPFSEVGVHDPKYNKYNASLHDYFFLKSADLAKPGGLIMHITSTGTMDKGDDAVRRKLMEDCELVAAYRLPGDVHMANAGTAVVTDMLILRKKIPGAEPVPMNRTDEALEQHPEAKPTREGFTGTSTDSLGRLYHWVDGIRVPAPEWGKVTTVPDPDGGQPIPINEYFAAHPENILGRLDRSGTMYTGESMNVQPASPEELSAALGREVQVVVDVDSSKRKFVFADTGERVPAEDLRRVGAEMFAAKLQDAVDRLPEGVFKPEQGSKEAFEPERLPAPGDVKDGGFTIRDGKLFRRDGGGLIEVNATKGTVERIAGMLEIRDAERALINKERAGEDASEERAALNKVYDAFVAEHGFLSERANMLAMRGDPDIHMLQALEKWDAKEKVATKDDIFSRSTVSSDSEVTSASSVSDGLQASLHKFGSVDIDHVAKLMNLPAADVAFGMVDQGIAFRDPALGWKPADEYLSGNVRRKLIEAQAAAAVDPQFKANVEALLKVQPEDVDYSQITAKIGAPWIPPADIAQFAADILEARGTPIDVAYSPETGDWTVNWSKEGARLYAKSAQANEVWGIKEGNGADTVDVIRAAMSNKSLTIRGGTDRFEDEHGTIHEFAAYDDKGKAMVNKSATADANAKVQELREKFKEWIWADDDRTARLERFYNDNMNNIRDMHYNGQHQTFPGMDPVLRDKMFPHIKDFVWQVVTTGNGLAAHEVGTGKTTAMIASAMELRRLGLAKKPCIACLKSNIHQITMDALKLYPGAKILSTDGLYDADKRQAVIAKMATGDYDIVIMTHDQLNLMKMSPEVEAKYIREELAELEAAKLAAWNDNPKKDNKIVKQLEKAKDKLLLKLQEALNTDRKDDALTFEQTGIDQLFVDECFPGETVVYTDRGPMTIAEIVEKELRVTVLSCNQETGGRCYKPVTAWFKRSLRNDLVKVTHERGSFICTPNHNIWSAGGYVQAGNLSREDTLRFVEGETDIGVKVLDVARHQRLGESLACDGAVACEWVYDIEVAETHNYFANGVNVSNSHQYKSLPVITKADRIKGIPTGRSQRATTMLMRTRWLQEHNGGRGVVFATGTPISNTLAELFTVQRYLQYDELKQRGLHHFDAWVNTFGEIQTKPEFTVAGTYKPTTRLAAYTNIPELMHITREAMDVVRADNVKRADGSQAIKRPTRKDVAIKSPNNKAMQDLMASLAQRADEVSHRGGPAQKGDDNMLVICTDGRKGAVDMRLLDDNAFDDPNSKTNLAVKQVLELHKNNPGGAQIIFSDVGVHAMKAKATNKEDDDDLEKIQSGEDFAEANLGAKGRFRLYDDIIDKLVKGGIPRDQIADFSGLEGKKKDEAMAAMRRGDIKVAIGSTQKLGTGCNVQDKVMAMHHLDVPWVPASVEQRDGRGWRTGNTNKKVEIYRYVAEGSLDQKFWDIIAGKASFQDQVLNNRESNIRTRQDDDSEVLTAEQLKAVASGDTREMERANLTEEVKTLRAARSRHEREQRKLETNLEKLRAEVPDMETTVHRYGEDIRHLEGRPDFEVRVDGKKITNREEASVALQKKVEAAQKAYADMDGYKRKYSFQPELLGEYRGLKLYYDPVNSRSGATIEGVSGKTYDAAPTIGSIEYVAKHLGKHQDELQKFLDAGKRQIESNTANLGKKFGKSQELQEKSDRLQKLVDELTPKKPDPKPAAESLSPQDRLFRHIENWAKLDGSRYRNHILEAAAQVESLRDRQRRAVLQRRIRDWSALDWRQHRERILAAAAELETL